MSKCKVSILTNYGKEYQEQLACDPFDAIKIVCKLRHKYYNPNNIIKSIKGYEYFTRDRDVIIAV